MSQRSAMLDSDPPVPLRYVRAPVPLDFPAEALVPETRRHLDLRTFLYGVLTRAFGSHAAIGSDQFVYFRGADPRACLAPDAFVRLGASNAPFDTWKTWERGAPELGVEILSADEGPLADKLARYHDAGFREVVVFDPDAAEGARLRVWDRVEEDLVERLVEGDRAACRVLGGTWCVAPLDTYPAALRLTDASGALLLSERERIAELEAELARRDRG